MNDLIIRQKTEDMIRYAYIAMRQYPKAEKHTLVAETKLALFGVLRLIVVCNKRYHKKTTLQDLDAAVDLLRAYIRLGRDLGYLPSRRYEHWARLVDEIGRMVGGWIKSMKEAG